MIHYTCDACKRELDPRHDLRYVVKMEICAAFDPTTTEDDDERDHLEEIQEILTRVVRQLTMERGGNMDYGMCHGNGPYP